MGTRREVIACLLALVLSAPSQGLIGGQADTDGRFAGVVHMRLSTGHTCSATKVGPHVLLTAAHCVVDLASGRLLSVFDSGAARMTLQTDRASLAVTVRHVSLAPAYREALARLVAFNRNRDGLPLPVGHHFGAHFPDVALLHLAEATGAIPTLQVDFKRPPDGGAVMLVGWGCRRWKDDARPAAGRAWGETTVIRTHAISFYSHGGQMRSGAPSLCPGDSGGPVLHNGKVVGVHGVAYGLRARYGARSNMATGLYAVADWAAWNNVGDGSPTAQ